MEEVPIISRSRHFNKVNGQVPFELPRIRRPCHTILRLLAIWQPKNANTIMRFYNALGYIVNLALMGSVLYSMTVFPGDKSGVNIWSKWANSVTTLCTLGLPFFYLKYFFYRMNYDLVMARMKEECAELFIKCMNLIKVYYFAWFFYTLVASTQNILCLITLADYKFDWVLIITCVAFVYGTGCWSCWLLTYCFECHVNYLEIRHFKATLKRHVEADNCNKIDLDHCLSTFRALKRKVDNSRDNLHILLSVAFTLRLVDILFYSVAFFSKDFPQRHTIWVYLFSVSVASLAIFIKLFPAALISSELSSLVETVGDLCLPNPHQKANRDAIVLHQYLNTCTQSMGYRILSIRITMQLATTSLVSFASLLLTVIKLLAGQSLP